MVKDNKIETIKGRLKNLELIKPIEFPELGLRLIEIKYCDVAGPYKAEITQVRLKYLNKNQALEKAVKKMLTKEKELKELIREGHQYESGETEHLHCGDWDCDSLLLKAKRPSRGVDRYNMKKFYGEVYDFRERTDEPFLKFTYSSKSLKEWRVQRGVLEY